MIIINNWKMDPSQCTLTQQTTGETLRLGEFHFLLLEILISYPDTVLSREFLIAEVWKNRVVGSNSLPTAIHALRLALGDEGKQKEIIKTIPKKGYLLDGKFITYSPEAESEQADNILDPQASEADINLPISEPEDVDAPSTQALAEIESSPLPAKTAGKNKYRIVFSILFIAIIIVGTVIWRTESGQLSQVNDADDSGSLALDKVIMPNVKYINLHYMYEKGTSASGSSINETIQPVAQRIDKLLAENDAKMDVYYYLSLKKLSLDFAITNKCNRAWQLVLTIDNVQDDQQKLSDYIYHHVERTLNEMPSCD